MKTFSDERLDNMCSYCGDKPETRDHVPSRILLNDPFPENLPVVPCCLKCNQDFSLDEEYFACALECVLHGTSEIEKLEREKVKSILLRKETLRQRIENSFILQNGNKFLQIESDRMKNVIVKLAKGHAKFENSEPQFDDPTSIWIKPLSTMTTEEFDIFFAPQNLDKAPEVGSRALQNLFIETNSNVLSHWIDVQDNIYKYSVCVGLGFISVKILIWEYFAVQVIWD